MNKHLKTTSRIHRVGTVLVLLAILGLLAAPAISADMSISAQQPEQNTLPETIRGAEHTNDLISPLNLTPEQRQKIRSIREDMKDERAKIGQRLRETNRALQDALDADNPNEAVVEQRLQDRAAAQAAQMRMRVMTELRIRRVLTAEQQALLHRMRIRTGDLNRERSIMRRFRQRESRERRGRRPGQAIDSDTRQETEKPRDRP